MKKDWRFVYSEGHSMTMCEAWIQAFHAFKNIPERLDTAIFDTRRGLMTCHTSEKNLKHIRKTGKRFFERVYRQKFKRGQKAAQAKMIRLCGRVSKENAAHESNQELWETFEEYFKDLSRLNSYFKVSGGRMFPLIEEYVKEKMTAAFPSGKINEAYAKVLSSPRVDRLQKEEAELWGLPQTNEALLAHAKKHALLYFNTYDETRVREFLKGRIRELQKRNDEKNFRQKLREDKKKRSDQQKKIEARITDGSCKELIRFLRHQAWFRFELKDTWSGAEFRFLNLFNTLARKARIPIQDFMASYRREDIQALLEKGKRLDSEEVEKRKRHTLFYLHRGRVEFYSGKQADQKYEKLVGKNSSVENEVKGTPASPGTYVGRVRVVLAKDLEALQKDLLDFKKGEVLVTTMTQPNMIFLMKKAGAIITSQGGMTSHAAVVSRELGIPCIVGTGNATEVFKTGDQVKVDALLGIAKKMI